MIRTFFQSETGSDLSSIWTRQHRKNGGGMGHILPPPLCGKGHDFCSFSPCFSFSCRFRHSENSRLPSYISCESAKRVTNKLYVKKMFAAGGIPINWNFFQQSSSKPSRRDKK
jgi:hypothetical protein